MRWSWFAVTSSSLINFDSRTGPGFKYQPWSFSVWSLHVLRLPVWVFCGSSVFQPHVSQVDRRLCVGVIVCVRSPPCGGLMSCPGRPPPPFHPPVRSGIGPLSHIDTHATCFTAFGFACLTANGCTRFLFWAWAFFFYNVFRLRLPDSFVWSFYEVFNMPALGVRGQVWRGYFWLTGEPGNSFGESVEVIVDRCRAALETRGCFRWTLTKTIQQILNQS